MHACIDPLRCYSMRPFTRLSQRLPGDWVAKCLSMIERVGRSLGSLRQVFFNRVDPKLLADYYTIIKACKGFGWGFDPVSGSGAERSSVPVLDSGPNAGDHLRGASAASSPSTTLGGSLSVLNFGPWSLGPISFTWLDPGP